MMAVQTNDELDQWIYQTKQGSPTAFNHVVDQFQQPIFNYCYRMLNDHRAAEDAAQEVFIRAYTKLDSYDDERRFSTWLYAIASNYCLDQLKMRRLQLVSWEELSYSQAIPNNNAVPEQALMQAELDGELSALLNQIPAMHRTAIILKYWHKMSYEEIATTLDITVSAVKSKLFRARRMLASKATTANYNFAWQL